MNRCRALDDGEFSGEPRSARVVGTLQSPNRTRETTELRGERRFAFGEYLEGNTPQVFLLGEKNNASSFANGEYLESNTPLFFVEKRARATQLHARGRGSVSTGAALRSGRAVASTDTCVENSVGIPSRFETRVEISDFSQQRAQSMKRVSCGFFRNRLGSSESDRVRP